MKIVLSLSMLLSLGAFAAKPSCDSPFVRLSLKPVPCIKEGISEAIFDIPELKLDLEDIQKIFQGAESSGGRVVGPMNYPRINTPVTPFPVHLDCDLKLLGDGGKRVSYLSFQRITLNQSEFYKSIPINKWMHGLIPGNDINSTQWRPVSVAPNINISNYSIELGYNKIQDELELNVCETFISPTGREMSSFCSQGQAKIHDKTIDATLKATSQSGDYRAIKTLKTSCLIR